MKQLIKLLITGVVFSMCFVGCGVTDPVDEDSVSIIITDIGNITAGDQKPIDGTIKGDPDPDPTSISAKIYDSTDTEVPAAKITVSKQTPSAKSEFDLTDDCAFKIVTTAQACNGSYTLKIWAEAGSAETSKEKSFTIVNGIDCGGSSGTPVSTDTISAGAQNSSLGSFIDLDGELKAWTSATAGSHVSEIDLYYGHVDVGTDANKDKVGSAYWAKESGFASSVWGSTTLPNNKMHSIAMTSTQFDAITTKEQIEDLWVPADGVINLVVTEGSVFIVYTTENAYALVRVFSQTAGEAGKIVIKVSR